ncbi:hypothetical protein LSAT2_003335, partial [Lamellibrachia satsuma]
SLTATATLNTGLHCQCHCAAIVLPERLSFVLLRRPRLGPRVRLLGPALPFCYQSRLAWLAAGVSLSNRRRRSPAVNGSAGVTRSDIGNEFRPVKKVCRSARKNQAPTSTNRLAILSSGAVSANRRRRRIAAFSPSAIRRLKFDNAIAPMPGGALAFSTSDR